MAEPITLTHENFESEVLKADTPVLVDFWAAWCGPCRMVAPIVEDLVSEYDGRVKVCKFDVDTAKKIDTKIDVPTDYGIRSIPTLLIFNDGKVADQVIGAVKKDEITVKLDGVLA